MLICAFALIALTLLGFLVVLGVKALKALNVFIESHSEK